MTYTKGAEAAAAMVKDIERIGGKALAIQEVGADADAVKSAVGKTVAKFGRLDVLGTMPAQRFRRPSRRLRWNSWTGKSTSPNGEDNHEKNKRLVLEQ
jgi:hypothetical protein